MHSIYEGDGRIWGACWHIKRCYYCHKRKQGDSSLAGLPFGKCSLLTACPAPWLKAVTRNTRNPTRAHQPTPYHHTIKGDSRYGIACSHAHHITGVATLLATSRTTSCNLIAISQHAECEHIRTRGHYAGISANDWHCHARQMAQLPTHHGLHLRLSADVACTMSNGK